MCQHMSTDNNHHQLKQENETWLYCHSHTDRGLRNGFRRFLVPVYYRKIVEKPITDPQICDDNGCVPAWTSSLLVCTWWFLLATVSNLPAWGNSCFVPEKILRFRHVLCISTFICEQACSPCTHTHKKARGWMYIHIWSSKSFFLCFIPGTVYLWVQKIYIQTLQKKKEKVELSHSLYDGQLCRCSGMLLPLKCELFPQLVKLLHKDRNKGYGWCGERWGTSLLDFTQ